VIDFNETSRILPLDMAFIGPNLNYKEAALERLQDELNYDLDYPVIITNISIDDPDPAYWILNHIVSFEDERHVFY